MKKFTEKFKVSYITAFFTAVMLFAFSFFFISAENHTENGIARLEKTIRSNIPSPAEHHNFQSNICRTALPAVNSSKNEKSSNPPLNRTYGALFNRTFTSFKTTFRTTYHTAENSIFQKYLKSSIPVRAGPHLC